MDYLSSAPPRKSSLKQQRQLDKRPWHGDDNVEPENPEADLFEQEMNAELEDRIQKAEQEGGVSLQSSAVAVAGPSGTSGSSSASKAAAAATLGDKYYDSLYFDSDEEEEDADENDLEASGSGKRQSMQSRREVKSNDDLMYDPDMDDDDQAWVDNIRKQYQNKFKAPKSKPKGGGGDQPEAASTSDAVLNCPACFSVLCLDCQRHDLYRHQYRAMFVINCDVDHTEKLKFPKTGKKKKKKLKTAASFGGGDDDEMYNPVKCTKCSTQVAVFDKDEVYHFFNVVASHS